MEDNIPPADNDDEANAIANTNNPSVIAATDVQVMSVCKPSTQALSKTKNTSILSFFNKKRGRKRKTKRRISFQSFATRRRMVSVLPWLMLLKMMRIVMMSIPSHIL